MKIAYATTNKGKMLTLQKALEPFGITVVQAPLDIPEPRIDDVELIAKFKARTAYDQLHQPVAANDSGFYVHALNGFPRAFVNFALETVDIDGIVTLAMDKDRACEFRHSIAFMDEQLPEPVAFTDSLPGRVTSEPRGTLQPYHWSRLARIFIPDGQTKTLAEMTEKEYSTWKTGAQRKESHATKLGEWLQEHRHD